jgi:hypothetical protein
LAPLIKVANTADSETQRYIASSLGNLVADSRRRQDILSDGDSQASGAWPAAQTQMTIEWLSGPFQGYDVVLKASIQDP